MPHRATRIRVQPLGHHALEMQPRSSAALAGGAVRSDRDPIHVPPAVRERLAAALTRHNDRTHRCRRPPGDP